ncbi:PREDICTED: aspartic [Prunus dulcis]|uniref:PREDICTED: aspartic n=1 Tax=Prunus dulcis TaxID=3755 RepID=A0A5E4EAW0_PRUDU|nr:PREDICTED: aspartic [Prunus dulcis]
MSPSKDANLTQSEVKRDMDDGEGAQLMKLSIGTPPHDIYAVADTGSTLLWTQCEPCPGCYTSRRILNSTRKRPQHLGSFHVMHQNVTLRMILGLTLAQTHQKVCNYNYSYLDETVTAGVVARETVTLTSTSGKPKP